MMCNKLHKIYSLFTTYIMSYQINLMWVWLAPSEVFYKTPTALVFSLLYDRNYTRTILISYKVGIYFSKWLYLASNLSS